MHVKPLMVWKEAQGCCSEGCFSSNISSFSGSLWERLPNSGQGQTLHFLFLWLFVGFSFFFSFLKNYLFLFIYFFLLCTIILVLPYINMNPPWVYTCSQSWTLLPPPSPYNPSGSSQCTSLKHPVSCIEPGLAIRFIYDIVHISMPFSQIIPPSPSPTVSKRLFY